MFNANEKKKGKTKQKKNTKSKQKLSKKIGAGLLSALMVLSLVPMKQVHAVSGNIPITLSDGSSYTGLDVDGTNYDNKFTEYITEALTTKFKFNDNYTTDLASCWRNVGMALALKGTTSGDASYRWKDFTNNDSPDDVKNHMLQGLYDSTNVNRDVGWSAPVQYNKKSGWSWTKCVYYNSGLKYAGSLDAASDAVRQTIQNGPGDKNYKVKNTSEDSGKDCVKKYNWGDIGAVPQDVYYMQTGFNTYSKAGASYYRHGRYCHTGVFLYNFKVTPYSEGGTDEIMVDKNLPDGTKNPEYVDNLGVFSKTQSIAPTVTPNYSSHDITASAGIDETESTTASATISESTSTKKTYGYETSLKLKWDSLSRIGGGSLEFDNSFKFSYEDTIQKGFTKGESLSESRTLKRQVTANVSPGNVGTFDVDLGVYTRTGTFNCPILLSFDVSVVNWVEDPSDNDAKAEVGCVANFGSTDAKDNAGVDLRSKFDNSLWLRDIQTRYGGGVQPNGMSFSDFVYSYFNLTSQYIPCCKKGLTVTQSVPALIITYREEKLPDKNETPYLTASEKQAKTNEIQESSRELVVYDLDEVPASTLAYSLEQGKEVILVKH